MMEDMLFEVFLQNLQISVNRPQRIVTIRSKMLGYANLVQTSIHAVTDDFLIIAFRTMFEDFMRHIVAAASDSNARIEGLDNERVSEKVTALRKAMWERRKAEIELGIKIY